MTFSAKAGVFALDTSTGDQAVTGVGFQPKLVLFLPTPETGDGVAVDAYTSFGAAVSSSSRFAITANCEDGQGTTDTGKVDKTDECILLSIPGGVNIDYEADFVSMDADGFTINIGDAPGAADRVGYLALGGDELTNVYLGSFEGSGSTGDQAVTGVGFQPDAIIFASYDESVLLGAGRVNHQASFGFAVSSSERACMAVADEHNVATTDSARHQRTDDCIIALDPDGDQDGLADFVSMDADGFTINWSDATNHDFRFIALKGGNYAVGSITSQTGTGTFSETGVGFQPSAGFFMSFCNAADGGKVANLEISLGFATSSSDRFVHGSVSEDNQATSDCDSFQDDALVYLNYDFAQSVEGSADFDSWDSDGFTLDQVDADPSGNEILYLVMGGAAAGPTVPVLYYHYAHH